MYSMCVFVRFFFAGFSYQKEKFVVVLFCSHNVLPIGIDGSIDRVERERERGRKVSIYICFEASYSY